MKKILVYVLFLSLSGCASLQTPKQTNIAVSALLDELQVAINEIDKGTQSSSLPPFKSAEVKLVTEARSADSGEVSLFLSGKAGKVMSNSNTITLVLESNDTSKMGLTRSSGQKIADYVIAAVSAIDEKKFLKLKRLTVDAGLEKVVELK